MGSDLLSLPLAQRLELLQTLWDLIAAEQQGWPPPRKNSGLSQNGS